MTVSASANMLIYVCVTLHLRNVNFAVTQPAFVLKTFIFKPLCLRFLAMNMYPSIMQ